jgi:acetoin utilization deacetylase AcuC-like enzyme
MRDELVAGPSRFSLPSGLQRGWNRLVRRVRSPGLELVYSPLYRVDLGSTPVDVLRSERIVAFLLAYGLLDPKSLLRPEVASLWDLRLAHGRSYLESLRRPDSLDEIVGVEVWPDLHRQALLAQRAAVGGTILATQRALQAGEIVFNLGGGFHHAGRFQGKGFCIFNDIAVAVGKIRREGFTGQILIIDLDLHDGNGTREIFRDDPSVFTFSIHNQAWDLEPAEASLSLELGSDVDDEAYLDVLQKNLPEVLDRTQPDLVYYLAGTDPAADDRIGDWQISPRGMLDRDQLVTRLLRNGAGKEPPAVMVLAGGYGHETWRYTARFLSWQILGSERVEPPSTSAITLARYQHLAQELGSGTTQSQDQTEDGWGLTEEDLLGSLGSEARQTLFLDHYSHHAVELAVEWTGIFDRLRQMGFAHPSLALDLDNPGGHTLRIFADSQHQELLAELRLRRDRRSIPGMEVLSIEWLLLQNPRASFTRDQPQLPGQQYPGLGMVRDVVSLLILLCDRLQLDGIVFVPSQYHLVFQARHVLGFLHPEDEGWFRALEKALQNLPLAEATRLVAEERVVDTTTGRPVSWKAMPMVLPISDRLHDQVEGVAYDNRAAEVESQHQFAISSAASATTSPPTRATSN